MSKFKMAIWIIVLALIGTIFFENDAIFLAKRSVRIDLYFVKYQTPELPAGVFYLAFLAFGFFIAYLFNLSEKFKARKAVKSITTTMTRQQDELTTLRREIETLRSRSTGPPTPEPAEKTDFKPSAETRNPLSDSEGDFPPDEQLDEKLTPIEEEKKV